MQPRFYMRTRGTSIQADLSIQYANVQSGFAPAGTNTAYATELGSCTYVAVPGTVFKAPSMNESKSLSVNVPYNGLWMITGADKLAYIDVAIEAARTSKTPAYRLAKMVELRNQLAPLVEKTPNWPFAVIRAVNGQLTYYATNRVLAKVFGQTAPLKSAELSAISAVCGDYGTQAKDAAAGFFGFVVAPKQVRQDVIDWIKGFAPAIAAQPFWVMNTMGVRADSIDAQGVLEMHMRLVSRLKQIGATMTSDSLGSLITDAVTDIDPTVPIDIIHAATDWYSGRYTYSGSLQNVSLLEGLHPCLVHTVYPDMNFNGRDITNASGTVATVVGYESMRILINGQTDLNRLAAYGRAVDILDNILIGITSVLSGENAVINPSLLTSSGVPYISFRSDWVMR